MTERKKLQLEIEQARHRLDEAMADCENLSDYYELSVKLDRLIERYIDLCEEESVLETL